MTAPGNVDKPSTRQERIPLAIAYMIGSGAVFALSSALSKLLVETYPVAEVLFFRAFGGLVACSLFVLPSVGLAVLHTQRAGAHVMRGLSQTCSQTLLLIAFSMMPLASATAINFSSPLFATLASAYFLKEPVGQARWIALIVGFAGVLIVTNPGADTFTLGALFALGNAVLFGTVIAGVRGMATTESSDTLTIYQLLFLTWAFGLAMPFVFITPTWDGTFWLMTNGVINGVAQYWWTRAIHMAPTAAVVPFQYLSLVWAVAFGYAIWGDVPTIGLVVGSAVVVGTGLFLLWRETRPKAVVPPTAD